jgi:putative ribosome biogenesis GTPase RsgA
MQVSQTGSTHLDLQNQNDIKFNRRLSSTSCRLPWKLVLFGNAGVGKTSLVNINNFYRTKMLFQTMKLLYI